MPYRFLLDEHMMPIPGLPLDIFGFEVVPLRQHDSSLVSTGTPDWMIYLAAKAGGFTGVITHETAQLSQDLEARAFYLTDITLIGFRKGVSDEITKWGLIMAYGPRIVKALDRGDRGLFLLPAPGAMNPEPAGRIFGERVKESGISFQEFLRRSELKMRNELTARGRDSLWP